MTDNEVEGEVADKLNVVAQYQTTRVRALWTSYKRIFQLMKDHIRTLEPSNFKITNKFMYNQISKIWPDDKKDDTFNVEYSGTIFVFKTGHRSQLLCQLYECITKCEQSKGKLKSMGPYAIQRVRKNGVRKEAKLFAAPFGIIELDMADKVVQEYYWVNISRIGCDVATGGFLFEYSGRTKIFMASDVNTLTGACKNQLAAVGLPGIPIMQNQALQAVMTYRSSIYASIPSAVSVFDVNKSTRRSFRPAPRQLHVSENFILEKDSTGFQTFSFQRVINIYALVRSWTKPREFTIEYQDGYSVSYSCPIRDTLLATLMDICHAAGNIRVIVTGEISDSLRLMPRFADEKYEASVTDMFFGASSIENWFLQRLAKACKAMPVVGEHIEECCRDLNANVPCPGISPKADPQSVQICLLGVLRHLNNCLVSNVSDERNDKSRSMATLLQSLYRIIPSIHGFKVFVEIKEIDTRLLLLQLLRYDSDFVNYWTLEVLTVLCKCPLTPRNTQQEYINKHTLLTDRMLTCLLDLMSDPVEEVIEEIPAEAKFEGEGGTTGDAVSGGEGTPTTSDSAADANNPDAASTSPDVPPPKIQSMHQKIDTTARPSTKKVESNASTLSHLSHVPAHDIKVNISSKQVFGKEAYVKEEKKEDKGSFFPNSLVIVGAASLLESIVSSNRDTTSPELLSKVLDMLGARCDVLVHMLRSNAFIIIENAAILMFVLLRSRSQVATLMKELALSECLVLKHFFHAVFSPSGAQRFISRFLVSLWMAGSEKASPGKGLLIRCIPSGLVEYLKMKPITEDHRKNLDEMEDEFYAKFGGGQQKQKGPLAGAKTDNDLQARMRKRIGQVLGQASQPHIATNVGMPPGAGQGLIRTDSQSSDSSGGVGGGTASIIQQAVPVIMSAIEKATPGSNSPENYRIMFHIMTHDHMLPDLIWNEQTRIELRSALDAEIKEFEREQRLRGMKRVAWNYQQFYVPYDSLRNELTVGPIYVRHYLEAGDAFLRGLENPSHIILFEKLFRRILVNVERNPFLSVMCAKCLHRLYDVCSDLIGSFDDTLLSFRMLSQANHMELQHCLLDLLVSLSKEDKNLEQCLHREIVDILLHYASLAHLNPDQIGNILARSTNNVLMIKDGGDSSRGGGGANSNANQYFESSVGQGKPKSQMDSFGSSPPEEADHNEEKAAAHRKSVWIPEDTHCPKMWFLAPNGEMPPPSNKQKGPFRLSEILQMLDSNRIDYLCLASPAHVDDSEDDSFKAIVDTGRWKPINQHFQLKFQMLLPGKSVYTPAEVSFKALTILSRTAAVHRSANSQGTPFYPVPISKKIMSEQEHLALFAQLILANDPKVVESAANIIINLVEFNSQANSKLYLTGAFYFICKYTGNNFPPLAKLLSVTHLRQAFHDGGKSFASDLYVAQKSILYPLLPPALITVLNNYGPDRFAAVYTGDYDTPEVIWNADYRKFAVEMIDQHIGNFPLKLRQVNNARHDYVPIAKVVYSKLDKDIYVHEYYLRNLCNEARFPEWPIGEPLILLRECIERWRLELSKGVADGSPVEAAKQVLGLSAKYDNAELRKAYKNLARQYHPDKNQNGREMFEKIHKAYETLTNTELRVTDTNLADVVYIIQTQNIIYRRFPEMVAEQKYPAYPLLIKVHTVPALDPPVTGTDAQLLEAGVMLMYYTTGVSPLNAREFVKAGLVERLHRIISYALKAYEIPATKTIASNLLLYGMKSLSAVANVETGRDEILKLCPEFSINMYTMLNYYTHLPLISEYTIEVMSRCCSNSELQRVFAKSGVVWRLIPFMMSYDSTLQDDYSDETQRAVQNQSSSNMLAILAAKCLGRLGGFMHDELETSDYPEFKNVLAKLLTQPLSRLLRNRRPWDLLNALNENCEKATKIWNVPMRQEVLEACGKCDRGRKPGFNENELGLCRSFEFTALRNELCVGGVYIRIFNKTSDSTDIEEPSSFVQELLTFAWQFVNPETKTNCDVSDEHQELTVEAIRIICTTKIYTVHDISKCPFGIELVLRLITTFHESSPAHFSASQLISTCYSVPEFIVATTGVAYAGKAISEDNDNEAFTAASASMKSHLWRLIEGACSTSTQSATPLWAALEYAASHPDGLDYFVKNSTMVYLLGLIAGVKGFCSIFQNRLSAISLVSKLLWHPVKGSDAALFLRRLLPEPLVVLLRKKSGSSSLQVLDEVSETPELIWTREMQNELRDEIQKLVAPKASKGRDSKVIIDFESLIVIDPDYSIRFQQLQNEIYLGGVYIRYYLKQPTFRLTNAVLFLEKLIEFWENSFSIQVPKSKAESDFLTKDNSQALVLGNEDFLSLLTSCIVCIIKGEPIVVDHILSWGFPHNLCTLLQRALAQGRRGTPVTAIVRLLQQLVVRDEILDDLGVCQVDIILLLTRVVDVNDTRIQGNGDKPIVLPKDAAIVVELLKKMFLSYNCRFLGHFVNRALNANLPMFLLNGILGSTGNDAIQRSQVKNASALKIYSVDLVKAIINADPSQTDPLRAAVDLHPAWAEFKEQSHDLYLTDREKTDTYLIEDAQGAKFTALLTNGEASAGISQYFNSTGVASAATSAPDSIFAKDGIGGFNSINGSSGAAGGNGAESSRIQPPFQGQGVNSNNNSSRPMAPNPNPNSNPNANHLGQQPGAIKPVTTNPNLNPMNRPPGQAPAQGNSNLNNSSSNNTQAAPSPSLGGRPPGPNPNPIASMPGGPPRTSPAPATPTTTTGYPPQPTAPTTPVNNNRMPGASPGVAPNPNIIGSRPLSTPGSGIAPVASPILSAQAGKKPLLKPVIVKTAHGIGLDIGKTASGGVVVSKLKEMPDGSRNPASICNPPVMAGDVIVGVNGVSITDFASVVAAIKGSSSQVELWIQRGQFS